LGPDRIREVHGKLIDGYVPPIGHKWFKPEDFPPGMTTDDTQLTVAVMRGLIDGHKGVAAAKSFDPYMDAIAKAHVEAYKHNIGGWGKSTTEATARLAAGTHWSVSGKTDNPKLGTGNGVPMKIAPFAAWLSTEFGQNFDDEKGGTFRFNQRCVDLSGMTHYTKMSGFASVAHALTLYTLLWSAPSRDLERHMYDVWSLAKEYQDECYKDDHVHYSVAHLNPSDDDWWARLNDIYRFREAVPREDMTVERVAKEFGGGSCYLYDSLPFSYAMFLRGPDDFQSILDAANAGGDNDTNAMFVGSMIGAYHGLGFFQRPELQWATDGLIEYHKLVALADEFCDTFGV
jgi:ADP-ribosylglycohydrolase